ncbi:arginase family hydrolase, arginase/agmainase/formiminoglutamate hydrolase [Saccharomonospora marina XMU15]|uniref:Arginase family hydrolase, arginase/agmainase/formiminoglutamate hydrolase n=1 Tax=Saccharomonospora marina XMU15 TaxID=882083 RepID=H5WYJ2_9PSEU|nr:arginase family protein [Saccharomonospora marina]EHR49583.1 arginase family hydrolase, arginase/agmainase/formiminoglutamate hydrolase [Saccharomonospora marina XMU15]
MRIHAVPQWQGALWQGAATRLPDGCRTLATLAAEVLGEPVHMVAVETAGSAGSDTVDGIGNKAVLVRNRDAQLAALEAPEGKVLTIGGDCGTDLVPAGVARYRYGENLGVVWFDAHADCNTPDSSPSGAFHGMVLRALLGEGDCEFAASPAVAAGRVVLAGTRALDEAERDVVEAGLVRHVPPPAEARDIVTALRQAGATKIYLHIDLDVLDAGEFGWTGYHEPGGISIARLVAAVAGLAELEVVGAAVTECAASKREQVEPLRPLFDVLGRLLAR